MKKLLVVSAVAALGFTSAALAGGLPEEMPMAPVAMCSDAGVYLGIQGGWGMTNWKNVDTGNYEVKKDNGFVGRAFLGYDINRYFALEAGYTYFFNKTEIDNAGTTQAKMKSQAVDVFGKIKAPVVDNFDLYAKLGANYLMTKVSDVAAGTNIEAVNEKSINVAFGAGADYYITPNVIANVEWLRFNGNAKVRGVADKYQPYTDAFMIGLRYKFDL